MERRAHSKDPWPQTMIFPEGTCTNRACLIAFKPGAFYARVPVQAVCVSFHGKLDTYTWTWDGPSGLQVAWFTLCQLNNVMQIQFLPVHVPTEEEVADVKLFARNVRQEMADALNLPTTDHTFEDCRLMAYAAQLDMPAAAGLVEFQKISQKLGLKLNKMKDLLNVFTGIAQQSPGIMTIEEFAKYLDMPVSPPMEELFELYDRDGSGTIDFREFCIGYSLLALPASSESTINLAFEVFDQGNKGYIDEKEFKEVLEKALGFDEVDGEHLFAQVDKDCDGKITFAEFRAMAKEKPEYAKLFVTYKSMKTNPAEDRTKCKSV